MESKKGKWIAAFAIIVILIVGIWLLSRPSTNQAVNIDEVEMTEGISQD